MVPPLVLRGKRFRGRGPSVQAGRDQLHSRRMPDDVLRPRGLWTSVYEVDIEIRQSRSVIAWILLSVCPHRRCGGIIPASGVDCPTLLFKIDPLRGVM